MLGALRAQGAGDARRAFPLTVEAAGLSGGVVEVDASVSSQFLSGLLMAAPFAAAGRRLRFGSLVSRPYLQLTLDVMRAFGVAVDAGAFAGGLAVEPQAYRAASSRSSRTHRPPRTFSRARR